MRLRSPSYIGCVSESGDFATLFFSGSATLGRMPLSPFCCQLPSVLVAMEPRTGAQGAFAVNAFYKYGDSFVIAQRESRREFGIHRNRAVPSGHAIKTCVRNFEATGSTLKKKGGSVNSVELWLQIARVTQSSDAQNGVDSFNSLPHYRNVLGCKYCFYTTTILL